MADAQRFGSWSAVDALILGAISSGRRGSSLKDLMAASDAWDKSYPTRDELASGLGALAAAGLIESNDRGFRKTKAGKALVKRMGFFGRYPDVLPYLAEIPRPSIEWPITSAAVGEAINAYLGRPAVEVTDRVETAPMRYFLSSLDSSRFEPVRRCDVVRSLVFDTGKAALLADISPAVIGQDFDRGEDITRVVLSARHEGESVDPITTFPCFVHVSISARGYDDLQSPLRSDDLTIMGWGELYRTDDDAMNHRFYPQAER